MKLNIKNKIDNVFAHYIVLNDGDIVFTSMCNEIKRVGNTEWKHNFSGIKYPKLIYEETLFVQQRMEGSLKEETGCIDLLTGKKIDFDFLSDSIILFDEIIQGSKILVRHKNQNRKKSIRLINLETKQSIWIVDTDFQRIWILDCDVLGKLKKSNKLVLLDIKNGQEVWEFDLSQLGSWIDYDKKEKTIEVSRVLGVYKWTIYLYLNSGKILILNVETGEKISVLENDKNTDQGSFSGMFMNAIELDDINGKLILLFNQRYTEVDLNTNAVTQTHIEDMKSLNLENMSRFVYDDHHLYFTDKNHNKLGALNRYTLKIDWTYDFSQKGISKKDLPRYGRHLELKGNRLYVLDNKDTLHIFEKQASPPA